MRIFKRMARSVWVIACSVPLMLTLLQAQAPGNQQTANPNAELVGQLTSKLHVSPEQATAGAGAIFDLAKHRMNKQDFAKVSQAVPGMNKFLQAAPSAGSGSAAGGSSAAGALGSAGSMVPGGAAAAAGSAAGGAGGLASLAGSFQSIGLSPDMIGKFAPVLQNYVGAKGGSGVASLFGSALK